MNKEKEIEEMADLIGHNKHIRTNEQVACILFDADFRKVDEIRKETAKEISNWLHEHCSHEEYYQLVDLFDEVFGVEVDE